MKITYVGGMSQIILGDIKDSRYNSFLQNESKDVPDYDIDVVDAYGLGQKMNGIKAVFNHGPHFVDAQTGKNPLWTCSKCGEEARGEFFVPAGSDHAVDYADPDGKKLCVACYLIANPHHIAYHNSLGHYGLPNDTRVKIAAAGGKSGSWSPEPAVPAPVAFADHDEEIA